MGGFARRPGGSTLVQDTDARGGNNAVAAPGKHTLTSQLPAAPIARKAASDAVVSGAAAQAKVDQASGSQGAPLPGALQQGLASALGADLGGVRVHTGGPSAAAADALQAKAYATGQDIHFGAGAYDPSSKSGQHLIAHEVAHTVQQQGTAPAVQRASLVSSPGDAAEHQADSFASAFTSGAKNEGLVSRGTQAASVQCFDRDEHRDIPTRHLVELQAFIQTPEGAKWAKDHGYDPAQLLARMSDDPAVKGEKLHGPGDTCRSSVHA